MSKDNFFVKFGFFYVANLKNIRNKADGIRHTVENIASDIVEIIVDFFVVIIRTVWVFIPVGTIYNVITSKYLEPDEIKRLTGQRLKHGHYCDKKEIKELEKELEAEKAIERESV